MRRQAEMAIEAAAVTMFLADAQDRRHRSRRRDRPRLRKRERPGGARRQQGRQPEGAGRERVLSPGPRRPDADLERERHRHRRPARPRGRAPAAGRAGRDATTARSASPSSAARTSASRRSSTRCSTRSAWWSSQARHDHRRGGLEYETPDGRASCWSTPPASATRRSSPRTPSSTPRCARSSAVERADVVMVMAEAEQGLERQDVRVIAAAQEARKPVARRLQQVGLVSEQAPARWDALDDGARRAAIRRSRDLPAIAISAHDGIRLRGCPRCGRSSTSRTRAEIPTAELNEWLKKVQREKAPPATRVGPPGPHLLHDADRRRRRRGSRCSSASPRR